MTVDLTDPIFHDEETARRHFEAARWPDGPICPHCGVVGNATEMKGKSTRPGVYKCKDCRKQFTATVGTLYERSHIPLHKWLLATRLLAPAKRACRRTSFGGNSASAPTGQHGSWRTGSGRECARRISRSRWAAKASSWRRTKPMSVARRKTARMRKHWRAKEPVVALVERSGRVASFHVPNVNATNAEADP